MTDKHAYLIALFISIYGCKIDRPEQAALTYCKCYEQKLRQGVDEMTTQLFCDSLLIMEYKELYMYYVHVDDTSNWQETKAFHTAYVNYKAKYCEWEIENRLDSAEGNSEVIY